jgi:hypothetical protein
MYQAKRRRKLFLIAPFALVAIIAFTFLGGWVVMLLWNWLAPALFGWRTITFWQAWGVLALCRILFGGFRLHGGRRHCGGDVRGRIVDRMADRVAERFEAMTSEERERFRQRMRERGWEPPTPGSAAQPPKSEG